MALSRKRKRPKRRSRNLFRGPLALDRMFDEVVRKGYDVSAPPILYHYTEWAGASGILSGQQFWATAHHCTNDSAELASADAVIVEVATNLRNNATGAAAEALSWFLDGYPDLQVGKLLTVCLACFSIARDDAEQWKRYGDNGRGICLGLRVLNEPPPTANKSAIVRVDYTESSWRDTVTKSFQEICWLLSRAEVSTHNINLGLNALYRIAAIASISAKRPEWAVEQEFRHATLVPDKVRHQLKEREVAD